MKRITYCIGAVVQLNQGNTKDYWVVADVSTEFGSRSPQVLKLRHQDELDCAGSWFPAAGVHEADITHKQRAFLLAEFADIKRGREIVRALKQ